MASHRLFLLILVVISVFVISASVISNPPEEKIKDVKLIDSDDYGLDQRIENILREFHQLISNRLSSYVDIDAAEKGIQKVTGYITDGKSSMNSLFDKINTLEEDGVITGNIIGFEQFEGSLETYDQIMEKSNDLLNSFGDYTEYMSYFVDSDEITSEFENQGVILKTQLESIENEEAIQTINVMISLLNKQIGLVREQMNNTSVNILPENGLFLKDRTYYKRFLESFRDGIQKVVDNPNLNMEIAFIDSDAAYKEYIANLFTASQLRQAYDRWYNINILGRFKELQELVVEFDNAKRSISLSG